MAIPKSALAAARIHNDEYQRRINSEYHHDNTELRLLYEDRPYKQAMMQAAIAQAEKLDAIAEALAAIAEALAIMNESKAKEPYLPQR